MRLRSGILTGIALFALTSTATAHHSFAMFDRTKAVTIAGDVKELQIVNPHGWLNILVASDQGQETLWSFETGPPMGLRQLGWRPESLKMGDHVSVRFYPAKDGSAAGQLISVQSADGTTLFAFPDQLERRGRLR